MLRGSVSGTAADDIFLPQSECDIEVNETDVVIGPAHQIGRLDIAVHITPWRIPVNGAVKILKRLQKLPGPFDHQGLGIPLSPLQRPVQTLSLNIIHGRIDDLIFHKKIIDLRDIRMAQVFQNVHLPAEQIRPRGDLSFVRFQNNALIQAQMVSQVDDSTAPGADFLHQFIG